MKVNDKLLPPHASRSFASSRDEKERKSSTWENVVWNLQRKLDLLTRAEEDASEEKEEVFERVKGKIFCRLLSEIFAWKLMKINYISHSIHSLGKPHQINVYTQIYFFANIRIRG